VAPVPTNNKAATAAVSTTNLGQLGEFLRILETPCDTGPELNTMDVDAGKTFGVVYHRGTGQRPAAGAGGRRCQEHAWRR